jgi:hypothetical protein
LEIISDSLKNQKVLTGKLFGLDGLAREELLWKIQQEYRLIGDLNDMVKVAYGSNQANNIEIFREYANARTSLARIYDGLNCTQNSISLYIDPSVYVRQESLSESIFTTIIRYSLKNDTNVLEITRYGMKIWTKNLILRNLIPLVFSHMRDFQLTEMGEGFVMIHFNF